MKRSAIVACVTLVTLLLCFGNPTVNASPIPNDYANEVSRYDYINLIIMDFDIISGKAIINCQVFARNCTSIKQTVSLQYWNGSSWVSSRNWAQTDSGTYSWFYSTDTSVSGGKHRAVSYVQIYVNGTPVETETIISREK